MRPAVLLLVMAIPAAASPSREAITPELMTRLASDPRALASHLDPARGLTVIEYRDHGGRRRNDHLCGAQLDRRLTEVQADLARDRKDWDTALALDCAADTLECYYNPGEIGEHDGRYLFVRRAGGGLALQVIVRLESGALDTTAQERFAARAVRDARAAHCP
jgi:hypothetical protein